MRGDRPLFVFLRSFFILFTPHARGSTRVDCLKSPILSVYPACAGIDRYGANRCRTTPCLPRMRGDRPPLDFKSSCLFEFTPHARGSTLPPVIEFCPVMVYPACAGIDHWQPHLFGSRPGLPRMRGDRPLEAKSLSRGEQVYPACAGIDPHVCQECLRKMRLPRMRGDRP